MKLDLFNNDLFKGNFIPTNPLQDIRDRMNQLQRKNDNLTAIIIFTSVVAIVSVIALVMFKKCSYSCCDHDYDDEFDFCDEDFEDDFEDIDESDFE